MNILTVLDVNLFRDIIQGTNRLFAENVDNWAVDPVACSEFPGGGDTGGEFPGGGNTGGCFPGQVPAPAAIWLFGIGMIGLAFARRKQRPVSPVTS